MTAQCFLRTTNALSGYDVSVKAAQILWEFQGIVNIPKYLGIPGRIAFLTKGSITVSLEMPRLMPEFSLLPRVTKGASEPPGWTRSPHSSFRGKSQLCHWPVVEAGASLGLRVPRTLALAVLPRWSGRGTWTL